jgi:hypothetical protein
MASCLAARGRILRAEPCLITAPMMPTTAETERAIFLPTKVLGCCQPGADCNGRQSLRGALVNQLGLQASVKHAKKRSAPCLSR